LVQGKTVVTLTLILANPPPAVPTLPPAAPASAAAVGGSAPPRPLIATRATLVVCAVSLVGQWIAEARDKLATGPTALKIHMYHGQGRIKDAAKLAAFDLVVTTYATLGSDFSRTSGAGFPPLGSIHWSRIVLDESHTIKNHKPVQSQACLALSGAKRWCVTGTPIETAVGDLLGQLMFLKLSPWDNQAYFDGACHRCLLCAFVWAVLTRPLMHWLSTRSACQARVRHDG
jgi:SWI/SNF-related matrix-associated actin-dependent regulator of chromatin subfamily A3